MNNLKCSIFTNPANNTMGMLTTYHVEGEPTTEMIPVARPPLIPPDVTCGLPNLPSLPPVAPQRQIKNVEPTFDKQHHQEACFSPISPRLSSPLPVFTSSICRKLLKRKKGDCRGQWRWPGSQITLAFLPKINISRNSVFPNFRC